MNSRSDDALYHLSVSDIQRSKGQDVVAVAAYRAGTQLQNLHSGKTANFTHRKEIVFGSAVLTPTNGPDWARDRQSLWSTVEQTEKRHDARLAKEIEFAIPYDIPRTEWHILARHMAAPYIEQDHAVDYAIHLGEDGNNPHIHMLITRRPLHGEGFGRVDRKFDQKGFYYGARKAWEAIGNAALVKAGSSKKLSAKSYSARGIAKTPGKHRGPDAQERANKRAERKNQRLLGLSPALDGQRVQHSNETLAAPPPRSDELDKSMSQDRLKSIIETARARMKTKQRDQSGDHAQSDREEPSPKAPFRPDETEWHRSLEDAVHRADEEQRIYTKALNLHRTKEEHHALKEAEMFGPEQRKAVERLLIEKRMEKIRAVERQSRMKDALRHAKRHMKDQDQFSRFADALDAREVLDPEPDYDGKARDPVTAMWDEQRDVVDRDQER